MPMPCIPFQNQNLKSYYKTYRHLLPSGPANLTASASLQPIRGIHIQLHGPLHRRCSNLNWSITRANGIFCQAESNGAKFYQKS